MNRRRLCGLLLGASSLTALAGCGQKGPLFLPQEKIDDLKKKQKTKSSRYPLTEPVRTV